MKKISWVSVLFLLFVFFVTSDAFCMGWFQPPPADPVDPGPVSSPEPGVITLVGIAAGAGVGYFVGRRKK